MSMKRRSLLQLSGYFGATALATGLGWVKSPLSHASEIPPLTVQLDWVFNVQFAGLLLADYRRLYAQKRLGVVIEPWSSGVVVPDVVAANPFAIGCAEQNLILEAQAKGAPIKAIATMFQASPLALMSLPESEIRTLPDLAGKKVGVHVDGIKVMELVKGVSGLAANDIEVVEIPYENKADRLLSGEFAAIQCYAVDEPIAFARRIGREPAILPLDDYGYKAYAQVLFTTNAVLERYSEQVKAFLEVSFAGWQLALADIPNAARLVARSYATPGSKYTNVAYQTRSLELVREYMMRGIQPPQLGQISAEQWQRTATLMAQYGIIESAPELQASLDLNLWSGSL